MKIFMKKLKELKYRAIIKESVDIDHVKSMLKPKVAELVLEYTLDFEIIREMH